MYDPKIGDTLKNNDPRQAGATVTVAGLTGTPVTHVSYYKHDSAGKVVGRVNRIRVDRIYTDGVARARGWSFVRSVTA